MNDNKNDNLFSGKTNYRFDKRNTERIRCDFILRYQIIGKEGSFKGKIINVSSGGFCMLGDTSLHEGEYLKFIFPFKSGTQAIYALIKRIEGREIALEYEMSKDEKNTFLDAFNEECKLKHSGSFLKLLPPKK